MKKVKVTKKLLTHLKRDDVRIQVSPRIRVDNNLPGISNDNKDAILTFLKKLPDNLCLVSFDDNELAGVYAVMPVERYETFKGSNNRIIKNGENRRAVKAGAAPAVSQDPYARIMDIIKQLSDSDFPEIKEEYEKTVDEINSAACTGCVKRGRVNRLLTSLAKLAAGHPERKIASTQEQILGPGYARQLARFRYEAEPFGTMAVPARTSGGADKLLKPAMHSHRTEGVRPSCLDCCRKHIAQAIILFQESDYSEYANHFWLGIGHLAEAESETLSTYPKLAQQLREIRLQMMADRNYVPSLVDLFDDLDMVESATDMSPAGGDEGGSDEADGKKEE